VLLWSGQFVSQMGDRLAMVAFPWLVYRSTNSAFSTAVMLALYTLPYVLFGTVAGVFIDRFNKRSLMVLADVLRAGLMLAVPLAARVWLPGVFLLSFLAASASVFFDPSKYALLPEVVAGPKLLRANSLLATTENLTDVVGYSAAGFVAFYLSTSSAFYADSATFLVSAAALVFMSYRPAPRETERHGRTGVAHEAREGLTYLMRHKGLAANTAVLMALAISGGASYPLTFFYAAKIVGGDARSFGLIEAALGLGYLLGAVALAWAANRVAKGVAMTLGMAVMGAGLAVVGAVTTLSAALIPFFVIGVANAAAIISVDTYFQQTVPERLSGRVWGIRFTLTQTMYAVSVLAGGALAGKIFVPTLFIACGALVALPGLVGMYITSVRRA